MSKKGLEQISMDGIIAGCQILAIFFLLYFIFKGIIKFFKWVGKGIINLF
jgi:hypothetical protein